MFQKVPKLDPSISGANHAPCNLCTLLFDDRLGNRLRELERWQLSFTEHVPRPAAWDGFVQHS